MNTPDIIRIIVPGKPQARKAHKIIRLPNGVRKTALSEEDAAWQNLVKMAAQKAMDGRSPISGHVWAHYLFVFPAPMSALRKSESDRVLRGELILFGTHADIDNLLKSVNDGLKGIAVQDDRLIRSGGFDIRVGRKPCSIISLRAMRPEDEKPELLELLKECHDEAE